MAFFYSPGSSDAASCTSDRTILDRCQPIFSSSACALPPRRSPIDRIITGDYSPTVKYRTAESPRRAALGPVCFQPHKRRDVIDRRGCRRAPTRDADRPRRPGQEHHRDPSSTRPWSMPRRCSSRTPMRCSTGVSATSMVGGARPRARRSKSAISEMEGAAGTVLCPSGLSAVSTALLVAVEDGRSHSDGRLRLWAGPPPRRHGAEADGHRNDLFRSLDRARGSRACSRNETTRRLSRAAGFADLRDAGCAGHRRRRPRARGGGCSSTIPGRRRSTSGRSAHGADLSLMAGTKYLGGHSDVNLGTVAANEKAWPRLKETHGTLGLAVGPDDIYLALRGLRTLGVRLERQMKSGLAIANWLAGRPEVAARPPSRPPRRSGPRALEARHGSARPAFSVLFSPAGVRTMPRPSSTACGFSGSARRGAASRASRSWPRCGISGPPFRGRLRGR